MPVDAWGMVVRLAGAALNPLPDRQVKLNLRVSPRYSHGVVILLESASCALLGNVGNGLLTNRERSAEHLARHRQAAHQSRYRRKNDLRESDHEARYWIVRHLR